MKQLRNRCFDTKRSAFTVAEILVVVVVLAILFTVLISKIDFATDDVKTTGAIADIRSIQAAAHALALENNGFPQSRTELIKALNGKLDAESAVKGVGSSIRSVKQDPWGREYWIEASDYDGSIDAYVQLKIYSAGANAEVPEDDIWVTLTFSPGEGDERSDIAIATSSD